jgi:radical SAM superfamily enzyme YgiQ (UPF0313 family)
VVLAGFQDQDNLGLRYLSSALKSRGHTVRLVNVSGGSGPLLAVIRTLQPHLVGFSLIFQYLVPFFAKLLAELRAAGVETHFTMGGHYASFEPARLLTAMPGLDSVVRFEGEETLVNLAGRLAARETWSDLPGIAYRGARDEAIINPPCPGKPDLDALPWPDRDDLDYLSQPLPSASILGGRGCPWNCSFCSIASFYAGNGTPGRRRRDPLRVVDEMEYLSRQRGVRILLWQDDDFLAGGAAGVRWAHEIARECVARGLHHNLRWRIACRSDEVRLETLEPLAAAGLTHVYLGVESGDPHDLRDLNKHLSPQIHLEARDVLHQLGLSYDFGFMLMQPWSTWLSVRNNLAFLASFAGDGSAPVAFCRTLPYAGTALASRLAAEGRLHADDPESAYDFLDPRLDALYGWLNATFGERNFGRSGTGRWLRSLLFAAHLDLPGYPADPMLIERAHALTAAANRILLDIIENALDHVCSLEYVPREDAVLERLAQVAVSEDHRLRGSILSLIASRPFGALQAYL